MKKKSKTKKLSSMHSVDCVKKLETIQKELFTSHIFPQWNRDAKLEKIFLSTGSENVNRARKKNTKCYVYSKVWKHMTQEDRWKVKMWESWKKKRKRFWKSKRKHRQMNSEKIRQVWDLDQIFKMILLGWVRGSAKITFGDTKMQRNFFRLFD